MFWGRRGVGAQGCDCNVSVVGSIPTRSNSFLRPLARNASKISTESEECFNTRFFDYFCVRDTAWSWMIDFFKIFLIRITVSWIKLACVYKFIT